MKTSALCAVGWALLAAAIATGPAPVAQAQETGSPSAEVRDDPEEPRNFIAFGAATSFHFLSEGRDASPEAPARESLAGFVIEYIRVLIPERLHLSIAKPFLFNADSYESPFEVVLKVPFRFGDWELYVGGGGTLNVRIFSAEREALEGTANVLSFGIVAEAGVSYRFAPRWGIELALGFEYIPAGDIVTYELNPMLVVAYGF